MFHILEDGKGTGAKAQVTSQNRLSTDCITRSQLDFACLSGDAYNISTGSISLTSDSESAVWYLKYDGEGLAVIQEIIIILGSSTSGTGNGVVTLVKNPTGGTIVSGAVDVATNSNRNFSSANIIEGDVLKGAEGNTITGGSSFAITSRSVFDEPIFFDAAPIALGKSNSIGVKYTPPTGNTSQSIIVAATVFIEQSDI